MTKFLSCINEAVDAGELDAEVAAQARATYADALDAAGEALGPEEADRVAAKAVMDKLEAEALRAKQLRALSIRSRRSLLEGVASLKEKRGYEGVSPLGGKGGKPPKDGWVQGGEPPKDGPGKNGAIAARALELVVENKPGLAGGPFPSIEGRYRALRGQFDAQMADLIERFETRTGLDAPNRADLENVVREAFGEETGDSAAKMLAKAWGETAERARLMFNAAAAGGGIGKIDGWGLPQFHDPLQLRASGKDAWVDYITPQLDRGKMIDRVTNLPFSDKRLRATLSEIYDTIATGGAIKRQPGEGLGRGMLANSRGEERFLAFKSADDWLAYQARFGAGDPFGIMMGHLDEMARDIARMQILGPNPDHQWDWLTRFALREAAIEEGAGVEGALERARVYSRQAQNMLDHFTGAANTPERTWLARTGATTRAFLTPAALGSAVLTDVPSAPVFSAYARAFSGLSRGGDFPELIRLLSTPEARAMARRSEFVNEQATDGLIRGAQDSLRLMTVGSKVDGRGLNAFARRLPATVFRMTGLTWATMARKRVFRLEFMGALADRAGKTLADLHAGDAEDRAFAQLLDARGFSEADWAKIRSAEAWEPRSEARFLRPSEIMDVDPELGLRVAEMIEMQTRQAVPETTIWTRAKLLGQDRPGTFHGEFRRSWAMFRSFSLTAGHLMAEDLALRGVKRGNVALYTAGHAAAIVALLTIAGGISNQLREIAKGNDPRDMTDPRFWGSAMLQGGGLGILGDFLYSAQSRAGKNSAMTGWGPAAAFGSDFWNFTGGNVQEVATKMSEGEDLDQAVEGAHIGRDGATLLRRYMPLASVWWLRAAWDRAVVDQLQKLVDPEADDNFRARARRLQRDYGQDQWWPQGHALPERAPDLNAALPPPQ